MDPRISGTINALQSIIRDLSTMEVCHPDPVEQRRLQVRCAEQMRVVADVLDDNGYLTE